MAGITFRSTINLGIPESAVLPNEYEQLQPTIQNIHNALRVLQDAVGTRTGDAYTDRDYVLSFDLQPNQTLQVQNMQVLNVVAATAIAAGNMINLFLSGGILKAQKAQANAAATRAWGWSPSAIAAGDKGVVFLLSGYFPGFGGTLTVGSVYYLSQITPGGISLAIPVAVGTIKQEVGIAISPNELLVRLSTPIVN